VVREVEAFHAQQRPQSFRDLEPAGHCRIEVGQGAEGFLTDADAGTICRDAPTGARVLILDWVVDRVEGSAWFDLLGLALFGAHERTEAQWRALLEAAGLQLDEVGERLIQATCP